MSLQKRASREKCAEREQAGMMWNLTMAQKHVYADVAGVVIVVERVQEHLCQVENGRVE